jgi:CRISPR/Cas system CMR subunit Cmr6 (Cas7 group RAMP superfamily)
MDPSDFEKMAKKTHKEYRRLYDLYEELRRESRGHKEFSEVIIASLEERCKHLEQRPSTQIVVDGESRTVVPDCGICLERQVNATYICGHLICTECAKQMKNDICPICRKKSNCIIALYF